MPTGLEDLPYRKRIPLKAHPIWLVVLSISSSILVLSLTIVFSQVVGMVTWEMIDTCLERISKTEKVTRWESVHARILFWMVAYPWHGLMWGVFNGLLVAVLNNRLENKQREEIAERLIRQRQPVWKIAFPRVALIRPLGAVVLVLIQLGGSWLLGISAMTSTFGTAVPLLYRYRSTRDTYRLAQAKFAKALDEGLIPEGTLKPGLGEKLEASLLAAGYALFAVLAVIGLWWAWPEIRAIREFGLSMAGMLITAGDATVLEDKLAHDENDVDSRIELASFYESAAAEKGISRERRDELREKYCAHVLWLIEHYPQTSAFIHIRERDGDAYDEAGRIWLKNAETYGNDRRVLSNAVEFFEFHDDDRAFDVLMKGKALEPDNPEWGRRITVLELRRQRKAQEAASVSTPADP